MDTNPTKETMQAYYNARRKAYMDKQVSHQDFYHDLAEKFGLERLQRIVFSIATRQQLTAALAQDEYLNSIPIKCWQGSPTGTFAADYSHVTRYYNDDQVRSIVFRAGIKAWALSDTVCILKAVARRMVQDGEKNAKEGTEAEKLFTLRDDQGTIVHGINRVAAANSLLLRLVPDKPLDKLDLYEATPAKSGRFAYTITRVE